MKKVKLYVVGILFDENREKVVLIKKKHPSWQVGLLNAPGGHVQKKENIEDAMVREFREETGVLFEDWEIVAMYDGINGANEKCECYFFYGVGDCYTFNAVRTTTDEDIFKVHIKKLPAGLMMNLYWLIPLCLDDSTNKPIYFEGVFPGGNNE